MVVFFSPRINHNTRCIAVANNTIFLKPTLNNTDSLFVLLKDFHLTVLCNFSKLYTHYFSVLVPFCSVL